MQKAQLTHALCDARLAQELQLARPACPTLRQVVLYHDESTAGLESRAAGKSARFDAVDTALDDVCLIAFTSGTTGQPKGTMHFHRDVMAACACWPPHVLREVGWDEAFASAISDLEAAGLGLPRDELHDVSLHQADRDLPERVINPQLVCANSLCAHTGLRGPFR